jgi:two-component system cell cycle sensor histidine kinase/response regulator CckA
VAKKILLVDDDDLVRFAIACLMEDEGFSVLEASCGAQALEIAPHHRPDLVVTDVMMPEMNGWEVAVELRRQMPAIPILFVSGFLGDHPGSPTENTALLVKPFSGHALCAVLHRLFGLQAN